MIELKAIRCLVYATDTYLCYNRFLEVYEYMKRNWAEISRGDKRAQWAGIYVTMNSKGMIVMNRAAHEKMGGAEAFLLLYDSANNTVGLKPTGVNMRNAYPTQKAGKHGGRRVAAYRLLKERSLAIKDTLEFPDAEIDEDGILILNLRTAKISNRALKHPRRREIKE